MSKPKLTLVGEGTQAAPYMEVEEDLDAARVAFASARQRHLQLLAKVNSPSMLRLHNGGALPHEDGRRQVSGPMVVGLAREMREIQDLADQAATLLELAAARMRKR